MAFIGIKISEDIAKILSKIKVPGEKEDTSEYHITVLYFEELKIKEISKVIENIYKILSKIEPFKIKTNKIGCFPKNPNHKSEVYPIIAKISDSEDLQNLNKKLKKSMDKLGVEYSKVHKNFNPHITLAYADKDIEEFKIPEISFTISEIVLWAGDDMNDKIVCHFPLNLSGKIKKNSILLNKINIFQTISQKL